MTSSLSSVMERSRFLYLPLSRRSSIRGYTGTSFVTLAGPHATYYIMDTKLNNGRSEKIIDNVSFEIESGKIVGLLGKNGCGKTTMLNELFNYSNSNNKQNIVRLSNDQKDYFNGK